MKAISFKSENEIAVLKAIVSYCQNGGSSLTPEDSFNIYERDDLVKIYRDLVNKLGV